MLIHKLTFCFFFSLIYNIYTFIDIFSYLFVSLLGSVQKLLVRICDILPCLKAWASLVRQRSLLWFFGGCPAVSNTPALNFRKIASSALEQYLALFFTLPTTKFRTELAFELVLGCLDKIDK